MSLISGRIWFTEFQLQSQQQHSDLSWWSRVASLLCVHLSGSHLLTDCCCFLHGCQDNASKLLLALMESRHDSENAERILFNLRPRELVRAPILYNWVLKLRIKAAVNNLCSIHNVCVCVCVQVEVIKKAYNQESEEGEGEVSPREVGHNIYILAQQVTQHKLLIGWQEVSLCPQKSTNQPSCLFVHSWPDTTRSCRTSWSLRRRVKRERRESPPW